MTETEKFIHRINIDKQVKTKQYLKIDNRLRLVKIKTKQYL